jgi:predicted heme/steroid binding protein
MRLPGPEPGTPASAGFLTFHMPNRFSLALLLLGAAAGFLPGPARSQAGIDFGPNVAVFDPTMTREFIQSQFNAVFRAQEKSQFGPARYALFFKPGVYTVDANVGFYTQVSGLGLMPDDVTINGWVHAEADWSGDNGTVNFWRDAENMAINPPGGKDRWAVSQASPFRRMHIKGDLQLDPRGHGWSSGGFMADTKVDGEASSGSQQQYITRNSDLGSWSGSVWNMVFVGVAGGPAQHFPRPSHTVIDKAPVIREKPFLCVNSAGLYQVFVPALRSNSAGTSWSGAKPAGTLLPISQFLIVKAGMTAAQMNDALAQGKDLLITPGIYHLGQTINVTRPDTVVLGLGLATLVPDNGIVAMRIADVDGVTVSGLLFDSGPVKSPILFQVGPAGSKADHSANPTVLHDIFTRIGGAGAGKATASIVINSNDVIVDHTWLWRADHGAGVGWSDNTADYGLVVLGNDVTVYGLFVEHFQKYNVIWAANGGRTYMFQNELPYDVPSQMSWTNGTHNGYAAYKVMDTVTTHEAWGLGSYCYFNANPSVVDDHSFEVPDKPGITLHDLLTISLDGKGTITHIINEAGESTGPRTEPQYLSGYPLPPQ